MDSTSTFVTKLVEVWASLLREVSVSVVWLVSEIFSGGFRETNVENVCKFENSVLVKEIVSDIVKLVLEIADVLDSTATVVSLPKYCLSYLQFKSWKYANWV